MREGAHTLHKSGQFGNGIGSWWLLGQVGYQCVGSPIHPHGKGGGSWMIFQPIAKKDAVRCLIKLLRRGFTTLRRGNATELHTGAIMFASGGSSP